MTKKKMYLLPTSGPQPLPCSIEQCTFLSSIKEPSPTGFLFLLPILLPLAHHSNTSIHSTYYFRIFRPCRCPFLTSDPAKHPLLMEKTMNHFH